MLANRLKVAIILIPTGVGFIVLGGWAYTALVAIMLGVAAWEYWRMFAQGGYSPSPWILIPGVLLIVISRMLWGLKFNDLILSFLALAAMGVHTIMCEKDCKHPASDFSATISGLIYLGFLGSFLISLRNLPGGLWWVMLAIPAIALGDAGAFFIGRKFGRHPLAPKVSPHKTIEGYFGGLLFSIIGGLVLAWLWGFRYSEMSPVHGLVIGAVLGVLAPLGDLGESMLKRQFGIKDTSSIFPGHGGMMDRMDSWIWGAVISYYLIVWLF
jgi:phosphatidate cytidylyltransferase